MKNGLEFIVSCDTQTTSPVHPVLSSAFIRLVSYRSSTGTFSAFEEYGL